MVRMTQPPPPGSPGDQPWTSPGGSAPQPPPGQPVVDADGPTWEPWPLGASIIEDAIVVGDTVFSARRLDGASRDACRRLAVLAGSPILGLVFEPAERAGRAGTPPRLRGATSIPDLRAGGEPLLAALASALEATTGGRPVVSAVR